MPSASAKQAPRNAINAIKVSNVIKMTPQFPLKFTDTVQ